MTTAVYALPKKQYSAQAQIDIFNKNLLQQLRRLPGVEAVGLTSAIPTTGDGTEAFVAEGYIDPRGPDQTAASPSQVIGSYSKRSEPRLFAAAISLSQTMAAASSSLLSIMIRRALLAP